MLTNTAKSLLSPVLLLKRGRKVAAFICKRRKFVIFKMENNNVNQLMVHVSQHYGCSVLLFHNHPSSSNQLRNQPGSLVTA